MVDIFPLCVGTTKAIAEEPTKSTREALITANAAARTKAATTEVTRATKKTTKQQSCNL